MNMSLPSLARALKDLAFPLTCLGCGVAVPPENPFCPLCQDQIYMITGPVCSRCGRPVAVAVGSSLCSQCSSHPPVFDQARAVALHQGPVAQALRGFKYRRHWASGALLAGLVADLAPLEWACQAHLLAPVPLHPLRLISRGFNQALVLFRDLAAGLPVQVHPRLLRRRRHTRPQVGLDPQARRRNVAGAFSLGKQGTRLISGRTILLVDDVLTTGATVNECARVLKMGGAGKILVLTVSRAAGSSALATAEPGGYDQAQGGEVGH